jgi:SprB repeat
MSSRLFLIIVGIISTSCVYHDLVPPVNCDESGPSLQVGTIEMATSCSTQDGSIHAIPSGGKEPYTFFLNDQVALSSNFNNLSAGIYSIRIQDANGCDALISNITVMAEGFSFEAKIKGDSLCLEDNGSIEVDVSEGNPPYTYKIDDGVFADQNYFTDLGHGDHVVVVKDVNDCTISLNITVPRDTTGTRWLTDIRPIMVTYCALNGCHNGISKPDLRIYEKAKYYAGKIKSKTQDRSMPFDGTLTQAQIDVIACWVDDGAPEN